MTLDERLFKKSVDDAIIALLQQIKGAVSGWKNQRENIIDFITANPTIFNAVYDAAERTELNYINSTLDTIFTYIETNLPPLLEM